jgi:hypothetical protein
LLAEVAVEEVRGPLLFEFLYAKAVVDFSVAALVGRRTVKPRPPALRPNPAAGNCGLRAASEGPWL